MDFVFLNPRTRETLTMPVTPASYRIEQGRRVELLDMAGAGELALPGLQALFDEQQEFLLPSSARSYTGAGYAGEPYQYVQTLVRWSEAGDPLRLIITETPVNVQILLAPVQYGERDGTGDVYCTLTMRQYRPLLAEVTVQEATGNKGRAAPTAGQGGGTYTVEAGDTLWGICRRIYGDGALAYRLAAHNDIKNANLIRVGQKIRLPDKAQL